MQTNVLYYGDNLDILRRYLPDASVDLVYLDPPFNSNRDYNVIFRDESGNRSDAQVRLLAVGPTGSRMSRRLPRLAASASGGCRSRWRMSWNAVSHGPSTEAPPSSTPAWC